MKKIICLSDTHNQHHSVKVPDGDMVLHAGDVSGNGTLPEIQSFLHWFDKLPHQHKIFCGGNHDWLFQKDPTLAQSLINDTDTVVYLQDEGTEIDGISIWGSPFSPWFYNWAFNLPRNDSQVEYEEAKRIWGKIPPVDILLVHGPMRGILDKTKDNVLTGCPILYEMIMKYIRPSLFVCGHIHEARGFKLLDDGAIVAINASTLCEKYRKVRRPFVIEYDEINKKVISITDEHLEQHIL